MMELLYKAGGHFNPHSHEGSDDIRFVSVKFGNIFQSTLPRRERPYFKAGDPALTLFQSTLPRRERRVFRDKVPYDAWISIHTPTKGATHTYTLSLHFL